VDNANASDDNRHRSHRQRRRDDFGSGSTFHLHYAFYVEDDEGRVGVFSEHCGYHAFGTSGLDIEQRRRGVTVAARTGRDR
jgi:hypothetical protein